MLVSKLNIAIDDNYQVVGTISPNKITDKKVKPYWEFDWMNWVSKKHIDNYNKVERLRSNREPFKGFDFGQ